MNRSQRREWAKLYLLSQTKEKKRSARYINKLKEFSEMTSSELVELKFNLKMSSTDRAALDEALKLVVSKDVEENKEVVNEN